MPTVTEHIIVARALKSMLAKPGVRVYDVADKAGMGRQTIYTLFDGRSNNVGVNTLARICKGMGMTVKEFYNSAEYAEMERRAQNG